MKIHEWAWGDVGRRTCCGLEPLEPPAAPGGDARRGEPGRRRLLRAVNDLAPIADGYRCRNCERMRAAIGASSKPVLALADAPIDARAELVENLLDRDRDIIEHATGWRSRWPLYRNHFCAGPYHADWETIQALIARGLMRVTRQPSELSGGDSVFGVTALGIAALDRDRMGSRQAARPSRRRELETYKRGLLRGLQAVKDGGQ